MRCRLSHHRTLRAVGRLCLGLWLIDVLLPAAFPQERRERSETLPDGVEHWYFTEPGKDESFLTKKFKEIYNIVMPDKSAQAFGRSIAFVVGVGAYHYISPQLPSVHRDIVQMREFLLRRAGFDEVYVAEDDVVNRDLIEQYVKEVILARTHHNDRLLFYYSGHGGDNQGKTGYMLFGNARKGQFWGPQVLAIDTLSDWSRELRIQHILFILDSCASGLGITPKSPSDDSERLLIQTLSGDGSRTILTAGTAEEATYALEGRSSTGNSVFTTAFLEAFESRSADRSVGFITITSLFADVEKEMAKFRLRQGKVTTPRMWTLQESDYRGTFVFLNPGSLSAQLTGEQAKALGITSRQKGEGGAGSDSSAGIIEVYSVNPGQLYVDGQDMGPILDRQTRQFLQQVAGKHQIRAQVSVPVSENAFRSESEEKEITVESGKIAYAVLGLNSPLDNSGTIPIGTLIIESIHQLNGDVFIDNFRVGRLEKKGRLSIGHLTAGQHAYRIVGVDQSESGTVVIKPNQTEFILKPPLPPGFLTATVQ